jgi:hypothetical protein
VSNHIPNFRRLIPIPEELASFVFQSVWRYGCIGMVNSNRHDMLSPNLLTVNPGASDRQGIARTLNFLRNKGFKVLHGSLQSLFLMEMLRMSLD